MSERKQTGKTGERADGGDQRQGGNAATEEAAAAQAREVVRQSGETAVAAQAEMPLGAQGLLGAAQLSPAEVDDQIARGGPALGSFVKAVGLAVAEAQDKLDDTMVESAKELSETQIDVIAVFEQEIDNDGQMTEGKPHPMKLPLINYITPTAYKWSRVYLQADMNVKEFNSTNGLNIQGSATSFTAGVSGGYGLMQGGWNVRGDTRFTTGSYQYGQDITNQQDEAAGSLHMEATLEPRDDIELPKPFIVQKGPRLKVTAGSRSDIMNSASPPEQTGRKLTVTVELRDKANNPLPNKQLEYRISQSLLNYSTTPADGKTDNNGKLEIEIRREGAAFDKVKPPEPVFVNVWLGLVNEQVTLTI